MNEVKHIHLGRQQFTVSVEAYGELKRYLEAITKQVGDDDKEVVEEVELRMAELLTERGCGEEKVVLPADVQFLKEQLGEPRDFKDEDGAEDTHTEGRSKRLFRDTQNGMVAGVAAGLGSYLGIDAVIVRLLFVILTITSGIGILLYILLWLLVPEAKTASDRLSMHGRAVTIDTLKEVAERADVPGAARRAQGTFAGVLAVIGKAILICIGSILTLVAGLALLWTATVTTYILINGAIVAGQVVFPVGTHEVIGFVATVVAILSLLLVLLLVGVAMIRRRWQLPAWGVAAFVGVFFIAAAAGGAFAPEAVNDVNGRVEALHHTQTHQTTAFTSADFNGKDTRFIFIRDSRTYVNYEYYGDLNTSRIKTSVENGRLHVDTNDVSDKYRCNIFCIYSGPDLQVVVHAPSLTDVSVHGEQANFISGDELRQPTMALTVASNSLASLNSVYPQKAVLADNNTGDRHLNMTLGSAAQGYDGVSIDTEANQGTVSFTRVGDLNVINDRVCDESDPYVFVMGGIDKLELNGKTVPNSENDFRDLRSPDQNNLYNCVVLRPDMYQVPLPPAVEKPLPSDNL